MFEGSKYGSFDNIYIASNGNGLYGAHDMGLVLLKYADFPAVDEIVYVTGNEQDAYLKGVIAAIDSRFLRCRASFAILRRAS